MMMGFGSYGSGGGSSSSSSNLSALAPPFTVDRSVSKPLVDLTEPPLNWLNTHSLSFDSTHPPNAYAYPFNPPPPPPPPPPPQPSPPLSAAHMPPPNNSVPFTSTDSLLYGQNADDMPTTNLVQAKPYYPSYVSPTKYSYEDYAQSLSGLWDGPRGWDYGKNVEHGDGFSSKDLNATDLSIYKDYADQGSHSSKGLNACEQNSTSIDMLGSEMHLGSANREQLDHKSFRGQISEFMPVEYSRQSVLGSTALFPETYSLASSCEQGLSRNHLSPYDALYEKGVKHDINPNDKSSAMKPSGLVIRSQALGSSSSAPIPNFFNNVENASGANKTDFAGIDNCSNAKDFHPLQISESNVHFDSSQLSFHLEGDNHRFSDLPLEKKEKLLRNVSVTNDPFRAKPGIQIFDAGPSGFNLTLASNGAISHVEGSSESLDYNLAVDSPCWKGAPIYHFSPLETSGPVSPQLIKKTEVCSGSNPIGPTNTASQCSPQKPSESSVYHENGCAENKLSSSPKRPYLANFLTQEHGYHHAVRAGSDCMKSSCGLGFQLSDYKDKPKRDYILANNSCHKFNFKPFHFIQQNPVEDNLTSGKKCELGSDVADVGMSANDASESCSSQVPLHATEHVLRSPSSVEAAPVKVTKLHGEESAPKMCFRTLISTIHNLSEFLAFHCSNEAYELKEIDLEALKGAVNYLDKCISKTLRPEAPPQESPSPLKFSQFPGKLPDIQEGVPASGVQVKKAAVSAFNLSNHHHVLEDRMHYLVSGKKCEKCFDVSSQRGDPERTKDDNMTKAIKKVLIENFVDEEDACTQTLLYKNLWLEAEAALCSMNYKARFDRMKVELEKCKSYFKENATELEKLSQSTSTPDLKTATTLPPKVKDDSDQKVSLPDFPVTNASGHPDDVMTRFHFLKHRESNANLMSTADGEKLSSSKVSSNINMVDEMASEAQSKETPHISENSLPNSIFTSHADDVEDSVTARFHILKSRIENSSCADIECRQLLQITDSGCAGEGKLCPEDGILDINMEPVLQHNPGNDLKDKLTVKEFHLHVKDDPIFETHRTCKLGNQLPASCYDSSSSDWEHVLKEDLLEQNS